LKKVKEGLAGVEKQPENTEKYSSLDKGKRTVSESDSPLPAIV
jgi:hypothetical protein